MLECVTNSSRPECVDYLLPESEIIEIIDGLCEQMPNMPGCTINKLCKGLQQPFCSKFSLLADICQFDMPNMKKCSKYKSLCSPDSVVKQCKTHASIPGLPTTRKSKEFVHDICTEMDMKGCDQCKDKNCESFAIYADLCRQMPGMSQCSSWNYMCNWDPNLPFCTVSSDPEWNSPQMKMYFHVIQ
jgi:copper transporter 1